MIQPDKIRANGKKSRLVRILSISEKHAKTLDKSFRQLQEDCIEQLPIELYPIYRIWRGADLETAKKLTELKYGYSLAMNVSGCYSRLTKDAIDSIKESLIEVQNELRDDNPDSWTRNKKRG